MRTTTTEGIEVLLDLSPDAVIVVARSGTILRANELAASMFRTDELVASSVDRLVPLSSTGGHARHRAAFHLSPSTRTMGSGRELAAVRADGSRFPVDIALQPLLLDDEPVVIAVIRDATDQHQLRRTNRRLSQDAASLREFVSVASHELRTPLTAVKGFAELLQHRGPHLDADLRETLLARIVRNADRQEALIAGLLDVSRIQNGRMALTPEAFDLREMITEVVRAFGDVGVREVVPTAPFPVVADRLRLEQILVNLITNAVRYGSPPILVHAGPVASDPSDQRIEIRVEDQGQGVPDDFVPWLFEPFRQASTGDRREAEGLGLGLHLANELVRAMSGTITYHPNRPTGSIFAVRLQAATLPA